MFCHPAVRRIVIVLTALILVVLSVVEISAQNFDDDPLMLDGGDEFGFEQFGGDDFQAVILVRMVTGFWNPVRTRSPGPFRFSI